VRRLLVPLVIVVSTLVFAPSALANYGLAKDGTNTLVVTPNGESFVAVEYTAFCVGSVCSTDENINSANNATQFDDNTGGDCNVNTNDGLNTAFRCPNITTTRITGTANADSVKAVCAGIQSSLRFSAGAGDDVVTGGGCTGSLVDLGPGDDRAIVNGIVLGGPGRDYVIAGPGVGPNGLGGGTGVDTVSYENRGPAQPVTITLDGLQNDGQAGLDQINADIENATGGHGNDTIIGNNGSNVLSGGDGNDTIDARGGLDFVDGGPGNDRVLARDGFQDRIDCGDGIDTAIVDAFDSVSGCESVDSSRALMPDVDADGVPAPADCDDHNAKKRPGFDDIPGNKVDEDCKGGPAPFPRVTTSIQFTFQPFANGTDVLLLKARGVPEKGRVEMRCRGGRAKGCFNGVKKFRFKRGKDTANIRGPVRSSRLGIGATLDIRVLAPRSIGKVVTFTMRSLKGPKQRTLCLRPGKTKPKRCGKA
jgi:Ca2+-binding RTX toxin-like protein